MMPSVLRRSGPDHMRNGAMFTPRAVIHFCDGCGIEGAPYGTLTDDGKRQYWCGYINSTPQCAAKHGERE